MGGFGADRGGADFDVYELTAALQAAGVAASQREALLARADVAIGMLVARARLMGRRRQDGWRDGETIEGPGGQRTTRIGSMETLVQMLGRPQ